MRWFYLALMAAPIGYLLVVGALYLAQRSLLYHPSAQRPSLGGLALLGAYEAALRTEDGLLLFSWYLPPPVGAPVIVYFHGNGGNIGQRGDRMRRFAAVGFGALLVEYRGYAGNPGAPTEAGLLTDARAALTFLDAQRIAPDRRVLYGESLGSGIAVQIAADRQVAALILESPYTSVADVAQYHYPWVPVRWLLHDKFDALTVIGRVTAPSLFLHAESDHVIPVRFGRALYAAAPGPKETWSTSQGDHEDVGRLGGFEAAIDFVRRRVGARVVDHAASNG
jgi:fermentation-respiration switch protein FrsA (DUF1100 family)